MNDQIARHPSGTNLGGRFARTDHPEDDRVTVGAHGRYVPPYEHEGRRYRVDVEPTHGAGATVTIDVSRAGSSSWFLKKTYVTGFSDLAAANNFVGDRQAVAAAVDRIAATTALREAQDALRAQTETAMRNHFVELARRSGASDEMIEEADSIVVDNLVSGTMSTRVRMYSDGGGLPVWAGHIDRDAMTDEDHMAIGMYGNKNRTLEDGIQRFDVRLKDRSAS